MKNLLITCGMVLSLNAAVQAQAPITEYPVYRSASPLRFDGKLTEMLWRKAPVAVMVGTNGETLPQKTTVQVLWDDSYLYVGISGEDADAWTTFTEDDTNLWENEVFESFIDPEGLGHTYYEINVSPGGNLVDLFVTNAGERQNGQFVSMREWDCEGIQYRVFVDGDPAPNTEDKGWSAELMIPFSRLWTMAGEHPNPGDTWRANFYRFDRNPANPKEATQSCFSSTDGRGFHTPWRFGKLTFHGR
ncbi:carbohydrate-binding family 9-like protein [Candidatus Latescibacterota bacterium]